jgi:hypothetical protein
MNYIQNLNSYFKIVNLRRYFLVCSIIISLSVPGCENESKSDCTAVICTMIYKTVVVQIKHSTDNTPFLLTGFKVFRVSDNKDITVSNSSPGDNSGYYPLVNDSGKAMLTNKNVEIEFQGFVNDALVITRRFVVTADCCHVSLVSGESVVYL